MARSKRTTRVVNYTESPVSSPGNAPPSAAATTNNNNHGKKKKKQQTLQQWTGGAVKTSKSTESSDNNEVAGGQLKRHSNGKFVHITSLAALFFTTCTLCYIMWHVTDDMSLHIVIVSSNPSSHTIDYPLYYIASSMFIHLLYYIQRHHSLSIHHLPPMHLPTPPIITATTTTAAVVVVIRQ